MLKQAWNNNKGTPGSGWDCVYHRSSPTTGVAAPFSLPTDCFHADCGLIVAISPEFSMKPPIQTLPWTFWSIFNKTVDSFQKIEHSMPNRAHLWAGSQQLVISVCTLASLWVPDHFFSILSPCPVGTYWIHTLWPDYTLRNITTSFRMSFMPGSVMLNFTRSYWFFRTVFCCRW